MTRPGSVKEVFGEALELPAAQRAAFLEEACAGDAALRAEVEALLRMHGGAGEFLAAPTQVGGRTPALAGSAKAGPAALPEPLGMPGERAGAVIGRYRLLEPIGEGGFGVVFMAEQREPVVRKVALKIIKLGMDTKQVIARFEAERQALALMDHPNIAKVLDAGATETGRPYFVMELVKGEPITAWCDRNTLGPRERLELFVPVCHAVQHAHQKGIIHRDLKPSNVLVTMIDGKPVPKVIDFGVAKATGAAGGRLTEKTLFTEFRQLVGTPEYMSPEQAAHSGVDIDTRSDVYSLGVLLYELLTGAPPFDARRLRSAAWDEMLRIIREEEPRKPSTRLGTLEALPSVAAQRRVEPARLTRLVRGDLDWIVMKCLEKDRSRRYETANGLAMDVHRHLAGEPVAAAPPTLMYRTRKFVRRNRGPVVAAAGVLATLIAGVVGTTTGMVWALGERSRAEDARESESKQRFAAQESAERAQVVLSLLGEMLRPSQTRDENGQRLPFVEHLVQFGEALGVRVKDRPDVEASVRTELGRALASLESYDAAEEQFRRVLAIHESMTGADRTPIVWVVYDLANTVLAAGDPPRALALAQAALENARSAERGDSLGVAELHHLVADMQKANGEYDEAEASSREALAMRQRVGGRLQERVAAGLAQLGDLDMARGMWERAERHYRESAALFREMLGEFYPSVGSVEHQIAVAIHSRGNFEGATAASRESVERARRALTPASPPEHRLALADRLVNLANRESWHPDGVRAAESAAREALEIRRELAADTPHVVAQSLWQVGVFCWLTDRPQESQQVLGEAVIMARKGDSLQSQFWTYANSSMLAVAIRDSGGDLAEAERLGRIALEGARKFDTKPGWRFWLQESELALVLRMRGDVTAAQSLEQHARSIVVRGASRGQFTAARCRRVGERLMALGEPALAESCLAESEELQSELCPGLWIHLDAMGALGECFLAQSRFAEAEALLLKAHQGLTGPGVGQWPEARVERDPAREAMQRVVRLYEAWDAAEPEGGYDRKAADWRARLGG